MNIAIIDADFIGKKRHRFPNLVCMKLSGYYKQGNNNVFLKVDYDNLEDFDKVFIAKVFTDTPIDDKILSLPNVIYGGTGFYYDKAAILPYKIEHSMPDYNLYNDYISPTTEFKYYRDYSIGFITRGCFRKCSFCVNKKYNSVFKNSSLDEFVDKARKKITLLDDNFLGYKDWKNELLGLQSLNKPFQFRQGLDERLLTDEKCELLFSSKYDGEYIFAFDDYKDKRIIEEKLKLIRKYTNKRIKFYVLCAYDRNNKYDNSFWQKDIEEVFLRIQLLVKYRCAPYIMRYNKYQESPYRGVYILFNRWCNQLHLFYRHSLQDFVDIDGGKSSKAYLAHLLHDFPEMRDYTEKIILKNW